MTFIGVDPGRVNDFCTMNVISDRLISAPITPHPSLRKYRTPKAPVVLTRIYDLTSIGILRGAAYPEIARKVHALCLHPMISKPYDLIIDATGVGLALFDMLKAPPYYLSPYGINFTGGNTDTESPWGRNVPKKDLIENLVVLFETERIKIAKSMEHVDTFEEQYNNYSRLANGGFGNLDADIHDDIVTGVAVALWYAEHTYPPFVELPSEEDERPPFNPAKHGLTRR